jgi:hypothetical protein
MSLKNYFWNVAVGLDVFVNTVFGGHPDETISSRWGRGDAVGSHNVVAILGADALNAIQPHHTSGANTHDEGRAEVVRQIEAAEVGR